MIDIFNDDAFSTLALTTAINEMDHVPDRAGDLVFTADGVRQGIATTAVSVERQGETLSLIQTSPRGGPAPKEATDKRSLISFEIPQIKLEDTIQAASVQNVRAFGEDDVGSVLQAVNRQMQKMVHRHDLTLEHHRLGALKGKILDADGSELTDLFAAFGILNSDGIAAPETFDFDLDDYNATAFDNAIRIKCQEVTRHMRRHAKAIIPASAQVWAFAGDDFFDKLIEHPSVRRTYDGWAAAEAALGDGYAFGTFEYGGIFFHDYRGTDDNATVAIADDEARFFFVGVPGIYAEYYAPADFLETVNTEGLPRYAKLAPDKRFNQFVELHTQQNPLPLCLRPATLVRGVTGVSS